MSTPYVLPSHLRAAPLGIDWLSIPYVPALPQVWHAALLDICAGATSAIDLYCYQPLRATVDTEQLNAPDQRGVILQNQNAHFIMQHWPILEQFGARVSPAAAFPRQWISVPATSLDISEPTAQIIGGTSLGSSGSDGSSSIDMAPGYIDWALGRGGYAVQIAYANGWPHAGLTPTVETAATFTKGSNQVTVADVTGILVGAGVSGSGVPDATTITGISGSTLTLSQNVTWFGSQATIEDYLRVGSVAGVTELLVDDVTGFLDSVPQIFDLGGSEHVTVTGISATNPRTVLGNVTTQTGPGTLTLASPTRYAHAPDTTVVTGLPSNVRWAAYFYGASEALTRGATAITAQALPGSQAGGKGNMISDLASEAEMHLGPLRRIF